MNGRAAAEKVAKGFGEQLPRFDAKTEAWLAGLSKTELERHLRRVLATLTEIESDLTKREARFVAGDAIYVPMPGMTGERTGETLVVTGVDRERGVVTLEGAR